MSPYSYFSLSSKRSEVICAQNDKKCVFCDSYVRKNVLNFQNFFCPEKKNFVCPGLIIWPEIPALQCWGGHAQVERRTAAAQIHSVQLVQ